MAELYDLESDVGERQDVSQQHPQIVQRMTGDLRRLIEAGTSRPGQRMTGDLRRLIEAGTSRPGQQASNDTDVRFETTQEQRWAPAR